ncbi:MAG: efflux RND transporter periplasmic adaptor subunit, partial [Pseudomonadota bacterium]
SEVETAAQVARIELAKAAEALRRRSIVAPFDGVVGIPAVEIGDWVDEDVEIAPFDDRSKILVEVEIPERFLGRLAVGHKATVRMPAFPRRVFEGQVAALDSRVDPVSRTLKLRVAVANEDDLLRPGGSFRVGLRLEGERYPAVPELALQFQRGGSYIWRVADGQAEQVPVDLVRRGRGLVLVDGALRVGDQVVVEGVQRLRPARAVEVLETLAPLRSPTGDTVVAGEERGGAPVSPAAARTGGG